MMDRTCGVISIRYQGVFFAKPLDGTAKSTTGNVNRNVIHINRNIIQGNAAG